MGPGRKTTKFCYKFLQTSRIPFQEHIDFLRATYSRKRSPTLSEVLFAIAVNGLLDNLNPAVGRCLYVDNLTIFYSKPSMDVIERTLQEAIDSLCNVAEILGFTFSAAETNSL
ncbi:hypothetical protein JTB14_025275 [Gonioctena quinquepunctata]|nr:hypothetical protein JTB14_025275 [Gonioctena quinquepunctata]